MDEICALQTPWLLTEVENQRLFLQELDEYILPLMQPFLKGIFGGKTIDRKILAQAKTLVNSRAFSNSTGMANSISPLIDMANHSFLCNAKVKAKVFDGREVRTNVTAQQKVCLLT